MDQQAFRQLLATPRSDVASTGRSEASVAQGHFGRVRRRDGLQSSPASSNLLPRKFERSVKSDGAAAEKVKEPLLNSVTGEEYVDRAAARRLAKDDDDELESKRKLLEERLYEAQDQAERQEIERQIDSLNQSAVRKGLDLNLLVKQKAKLKRTTPDNELIGDDDLEVAYRSGTANHQQKVNEGGFETAPPSKFRPIGSTSKEPQLKQEDKPEYIWRDGKRMRKKKKPIVENGESRVLAASTSIAPAIEAPAKAPSAHSSQSKSPLRVEKPTEKADKKVPISNGPQQGVKETLAVRDGEERTAVVEKIESSNDEEEDIFADAGRWQGLDDSDSDEEGAASSTNALAAAAAPLGPSGKKDWFATGTRHVTKDDALEARLPSDLDKIVEGAGKAKEIHERKVDEENLERRSSSESGQEAERPPSKTQRLEGFSDSILGREGVRYMLEKKDEEGSDRKRRRKRSKKGKGGYGSD